MPDSNLFQTPPHHGCTTYGLEQRVWAPSQLGSFASEGGEDGR